MCYSLVLCCTFGCQMSLGLIISRIEPVMLRYALFSSRVDLLGIYEHVILTDIEFSDSQNVDQALWKNVFYQVIESFRQLLKDPSNENISHIRNMLLTLLDEVRNIRGICTCKDIIISYNFNQFVQHMIFSIVVSAFVV